MTAQHEHGGTANGAMNSTAGGTTNGTPEDTAEGAAPRVRVALLAEHCVGAGQCVLAAPEVFEQDEEGVAVVLDERPGPELGEAVNEAVDLCPSGALQLLPEN